MKRITSSIFLLVAALAACTAEETVLEGADFKFDGTCVNCHAGLTAGHVHTNYKLRCIDCHGGNDQVPVPERAFENTSLATNGGGFRDDALIRQAHVLPGSDNGKPGTQIDGELARFFYANGIDDDMDGFIDESLNPDLFVAGGNLNNLGEVFEPGVHGEGGGEFMDMELNRDLNYTRFLNPGDLRVATIGCGRGNRAAFDGGGGGACHQETIDIVRRSIMVNQAAVTNGAYYGNESWDLGFQQQRDKNGEAEDPRFGAFSYALDYDGNPDCIKPPADLTDPRSQPFFDRACLQARATAEDREVRANAGNDCGPAGNDQCGNANLPALEIAQGTIKGDPDLLASNTTLRTQGAGDSRWEGWGGQPRISDAHAELAPLQDRDIPGLEGAVPDPVDNILRTFRAYYPLNYPASTTNFNFTFGSSILPDVKNVRTANPYGRGHSSGCSACHTPYNYEGNRRPQRLRQDDGSFLTIDDPTTKHREFDPAKDEGPRDDSAARDGSLIRNRLIGRPVGIDEVIRAGGVAKGAVDFNGDNVKDGEQQKTYSDNHTTTTKIDTDTCGLCHGFVTRINYAYQGAAEEEQRDVLSRRGAIEFTTPAGTNVAILDSWVREDVTDPNNPRVIKPAGVAIVAAAKARDEELKNFGCLPGQQFPQCGMIAGAGGCAQNTFSEDCNNDGELQTSLTLERRDPITGEVILTRTINEDLNGNGKLDLIDRLPREKAIDGRQVRYVYGGRNGSTRQMDVHFERGMHCIDCHFMQDVHGDGNVYSTNWDAIEIECEDCHGANNRTNFRTSGPNGGNDLRLPVNENLEPFFEEINGQVIQRSRVNTGLSWVVPQTIDANRASPYAAEAHNGDYHVAEPGQGSEFTGEQGQSEITRAKVECATCHNGFLTNCVGCHVSIDVGNQQRKKVNADGSVVASAGENEIWLRNKHNRGHIDFQLLALLRSTFTMGVSSKSEQGRLGLFRSSMQVNVAVTDGNGDQLREGLSFTTFQNLDGNSGRMNAALSGVAMNQTMAHTVRPNEARGCEMCHSLVDNQNRTKNEHIIAYAYGVGAGSITYLSDFVYAVGANGLELFEYKQEKELNNHNAGTSNRFPGLIVNPNVADRKAAAVEPIVPAGSVATDVVLIRNYNQTPGIVGETQAPSLRDFAAIGLNNGGAGSLVITDVSARAHPSAARPALNNAALVQTINLPQPPRALAHLQNDVSDPFIYIATGTAGICVVEMGSADLLGGAFNAQEEVCTAVTGTANEIATHGDFLFVGTVEGNVDVFQISTSNAKQMTRLGGVNVGAQVNEIQVVGFALYVATQQGLTILELSDIANPARPAGAPQFIAGTAPALSVAASEGRAYVATGTNLFEVDVRTIAAPKAPVSIVPAGQTVNAADVVVSTMPGQRWVIALETGGDVVGIKLDGTESKFERCFPDPGAADCLLDIDMYDATRSSRDPSFDPLTGTFDAADPSGQPFFRMQSAILTDGRRMVRPTLFEQIGFLSGRRYRDSFMPGSGVLSFPVMQNMRSIQVCETGNPSTNPSGIGELGYPDGNGGCDPFGSASAKPMKVCKGAKFGPGLKRILCDTPDVRTAQPQQPAPAPVLPQVRGERSAMIAPRRP